MKRWLFLLPILLFVAVAAFFFRGLSLDPKHIPSPLIGKPAPAFSLPGLRRGEGVVTTTALEGQITLVNFFASWCVPCRVEHPLFMELARQGTVQIVGVNWKDNPENALAWLAQLGDPYSSIGVDPEGRAGIDWGVYGVPETYVVDREGRIRFKQVGPLTDDVWRAAVLPVIKDLSR